MTRAAFEAWFEADCMPSEADWFKRDSDEPDEYHYGETHAAWRAWTASRAAALEKAAMTCRSLAQKQWTIGRQFAALDCEAAIREIGKEAG